MSRSYRKTPIYPIASSSPGAMRWYKRYWNSRARRMWKDAVSHGDYDLAEAELMWNEWDSPRDGQHYWGKGFDTYKGRSK